jgi:hypothetical protein
MNIRTIEDGFEHQMNSVFLEMKKDYKEEQRERKSDGYEIQTFAEWLWSNLEDFGELVYNRFDEYAGMDESTKEFNYTNSK